MDCGKQDLKVWYLGQKERFMWWKRKAHNDAADESPEGSGELELEF